MDEKYSSPKCSAVIFNKEIDHGIAMRFVLLGNYAVRKFR
jgi:hypothetical protein